MLWKHFFLLKFVFVLDQEKQIKGGDTEFEVKTIKQTP